MAHERGVNLSQYAVARTLATVDDSADYEISGFADENDTPISAEEAAFLREGTLRGLEAEAQGRYRPAIDVFHGIVRILHVRSATQQFNNSASQG